MKQPIHIPPAVAEVIAICYQSMQSALECARSVAHDPNTPRQVANDFASVAASIRFPLERIDRRIPKESFHNFLYQVKENDAMRFENIKSLYFRMTPEQQEMMELAAQGIKEGSFTIETKEDA